MSFATFLVLLPIFSLSVNVNALGINCQGSILCGYKNKGEMVLDTFYDAMTSGSQSFIPGGPLEDERVYYNGQPQDVACWEDLKVCLFLQGNIPSTGMNGSTIKLRLNELRLHGCRICGSVPISGNNDPYNSGYLTSNFVTSGSCNGICQTVSHPEGIPSTAPSPEARVEGGPWHGGGLPPGARRDDHSLSS